MGAENDQIQAAIAASDAVALAKLASGDDLERLKAAEEVVELARNRTRSSFTLATVSQLIVGVVALGGMLMSIYQVSTNRAQQAAQSASDQDRWNKEFQRAQRADKYRAFFETSVLATDPANADKRLVGYALLQEFVEDDEYNSKATLMLEESLMQELRSDTKAGLDEAHRNAVVAIVSALAQSSDCKALERASRSISRITQRHLSGGDVEETQEVFAIYVRRLVGRATLRCKTMKDFDLVRRPLADAVLRVPELAELKGKPTEPEAFARIAHVLVDRCSNEVSMGGGGECAQIAEKYAGLCAAAPKDDAPACEVMKAALPVMSRPSAAAAATPE
jgi:hypothetical protein